MKSKHNLDDVLRLIFITSIVVFLVSVAFDIYKGSNSLPILPFVSWFIAFVVFLVLFSRAKRSNNIFIKPSKGSAKDGFVFLLSTKDAMEAEVIKGLLASNGIKAIIKHAMPGSFGVGLDAYIHAYLGQSSFSGLIVVNIYVNADDLEKAKNIIKKHSNKG